MKILIICSNLIGDTILSTGAIKRFIDKYKDAKISLVIGPTAAPIFRNYTNIDEVIIFKKRKFNFHWIDILKKTYKIKWDIVIDFRSSALSYFLKNKKKYIFKKQKGLHHIDQLNFSFGFSCSKLFVPTSLNEENQVTQILEKTFKHIVVFPGGNWMPKLWSDKNYNIVMQSLLKKYNNIKFILVGSTKEKENYYRNLVNGIDEKLIIDLFGCSLTLTSAFMKKSDLFLGNDSGLMHLAVSNQLRVISLFGPTDDKIYGPYGDNNIVIRTKENLDYFKTINIDTNKSYMNSIKTNTVIDVIEKLLK